MRSAVAVAALAPILVIAACSESPTAVLPVEYEPASSFGAHRGTNALAVLSGRREIPPRETRALGLAVFHASKDQSELHFKLLVANIRNVVQAHIHLGSPEENGPVVVFLYGPVPPGGGRESGILSHGVITEADFIGPLAGASMEDLIAAMKANGAYVNVHTNDGVDPTNTGPGDFPGGEVRGQVNVLHHH